MSDTKIVLVCRIDIDNGIMENFFSIYAHWSRICGRFLVDFFPCKGINLEIISSWLFYHVIAILGALSSK